MSEEIPGGSGHRHAGGRAPGAPHPDAFSDSVHYLVNRKGFFAFFEMIYWLILSRIRHAISVINYGKPSINIHLPAASFLHLPAPAPRGALSPQQLLRVIGQLRHHHRLHVVVEGREG